MSWFVRNIRDVQWRSSPFGTYGDFEQGEPFPELGFNFGLVWPGQPLGMYHREDNQEGFLLLSGECVLIVDGEERSLRQWDYFHCPAGVDHMIVGAGHGPAFLIAVGSRTAPAATVYPVDPVALRHGAGVREETRIPAEAYAAFPEEQPVAFEEGFLPGGF